MSVISSLSSLSWVSSLNRSGVNFSKRVPRGGAGGVRMGPCGGFEVEGPRHGLRPPRDLEKPMIWQGEVFSWDE